MYEVALGDEVRRYQLLRSARRTLAITVEPGGALVVTAPETATMPQVEAVLRRRREWVRRRTREAIALPPSSPPRKWVSGETHRYLGRQYRLRVLKGTRPSVRLTGGRFLVTTATSNDPPQVRQAMQRWYLAHAREVFTRRMQELLRRTPLLGIPEMPPLIVRRLVKRWGSCSPDGRILMNVDAVKLPVGCVDYLLLHELCHLRYPHHGAAFWRLLDSCMPDWEHWRKRLDEVEV